MNMPTNVQNMYAITHQAKLGKFSRVAAIIEAMNVMSQASLIQSSVSSSSFGKGGNHIRMLLIL